MKNGLLTVRPTADAEVPAARTGVLLGAGSDGPVHLRLLRQSGTRIALVADLVPVQLLALRAAAASVPVEVVTGRRPAWQPLPAAAPGVRLHGAEPFAPPPGPAVVIYDHPAGGPGHGPSGARSAADVRPWQCRIDVRPQWTAEQASTLAAAHLAIVGRVSAVDAARLAAAFGLPEPALDAVPGLADLTYALLRRGRLQYARVEPSEAERQVVEAVGAQLTAPRIAP